MSYEITRFYQDASIPAETVRVGLTLAEAQEHCRHPETSSRTAVGAEGVARTAAYGPWFDGYMEVSDAD